MRRSSQPKYFLANTRFNKQAKFLNLKQRAMTVEEYEMDFDELSHSVSEMVATEAIRTKKFIQGLKVSL